MQRKSLCQKITAGLSNVFYGAVGLGSSIPSAQYAAPFSYKIGSTVISPSKVSYDWFVSLSAASEFHAVVNMGCTAALSSIFVYRYLKNAVPKIKEEYLLFRQRKNTKRFLTVTSLSLLAAVAGGSISGDPYSGPIKAGAIGVGFATTLALSFHGVYDLLIKRTDDYAFKLKVVDSLKCLDPKYLIEIDEMLQGKQLNVETVPEFLTQCFNLESKYKLSIVREKTELEVQREYNFKIADYAISGTLAGVCSLIYIQSGFSGVNVIAKVVTNNSLDNLPDAAKIAIGFLPGMPLTLFAFYTLKFFQSPLVQLYPEIKKDTKSIAKTLGLVGLGVGNAAWYFGLAKLITEDTNIFPFILDTPFGEYVFPWAAYLTCLNMGINGLTPMVFAPDLEHPKLADVIKSIEQNIIPMESYKALSGHSFFTKVVEEKKEVKIEIPAFADVPRLDRGIQR